MTLMKPSAQEDNMTVDVYTGCSFRLFKIGYIDVLKITNMAHVEADSLTEKHLDRHIRDLEPCRAKVVVRVDVRAGVVQHADVRGGERERILQACPLAWSFRVSNEARGPATGSTYV